ncbi:MAG: polymer-forming cytoskeletal protein [Ruminococcaceae bacterium]|nr:polymer-forming cytoskeletal protein [Oscillospiraceae bacterium]
MGIKDNFSQAVKELWKKDGMEEGAESSAARDNAPTQLDRYLAEQNEAQPPVQQPAAPAAQQAPAAPVQQTAPAQNAPIQQDVNAAGVPLETPYYPTKPINNPQPAPEQTAPAQPQAAAPAAPAQNAQSNYGTGYGANAQYNANNGFNAAPSAPSAASVNANVNRATGVTDEVTVISKNTVIDGNIRSLANMQVDGNIKGNVETTRDIDMSGKVVGDMKCNNATMNSAAMQGNMVVKGKMRMDRDTILIGDLSSQYADVNGRIRGKLDIAGKAELKRDAIVFGDINASTIAVTDGAIIQGYVNTTFLSKEDSRNAFPDAISLDAGKPENVK